MKKRLFAIVLMFVMALSFGLVACTPEEATDAYEITFAATMPTTIAKGSEAAFADPTLKLGGTTVTGVTWVWTVASTSNGGAVTMNGKTPVVTAAGKAKFKVSATVEGVEVLTKTTGDINLTVPATPTVNSITVTGPATGTLTEGTWVSTAYSASVSVSNGAAETVSWAVYSGTTGTTAITSGQGSFNSTTRILTITEAGTYRVRATSTVAGFTSVYGEATVIVRGPADPANNKTSFAAWKGHNGVAYANITVDEYGVIVDLELDEIDDRYGMGWASSVANRNNIALDAPDAEGAVAKYIRIGEIKFTYNATTKTYDSTNAVTKGFAAAEFSIPSGSAASPSFMTFCETWEHINWYVESMTAGEYDILHADGSAYENITWTATGTGGHDGDAVTKENRWIKSYVYSRNASESTGTLRFETNIAAIENWVLVTNNGSIDGFMNVLKLNKAQAGDKTAADEISSGDGSYYYYFNGTSYVSTGATFNDWAFYMQTIHLAYYANDNAPAEVKAAAGTITGPATVTSNSATKYTATISTAGASQDVIWSLKAAYTGVSITRTGLVNITAAAAAGTFTIVAKSAVDGSWAGIEKVITITADSIAFQSAVANGTANTTASTVITLTFNKDIAGFAAGNITLSNTALTKGALTRTGTGTYTLAITGTWAQGDKTNVTIASVTGLAPTTINDVVLNAVTASSTPVTFSSVTADGTTGATDSTKLTLVFSAAIADLAVGDITLTSTSGVTKGTLSTTGTAGTYELTLSGTWANGDTVTVAVSKSGYTITNNTSAATLFKAPPTRSITVAAAPQALGSTYYYIGVPVTVVFGADDKVVSVSYDNISWASTNGTINDHGYGASNSDRSTAFNADKAKICAGLVGKSATEIAAWDLITTMGSSGVNRALYESRLSSGTLTSSSGATLSNGNVFNSIRLAALIYLGKDDAGQTAPAVAPEVTLNIGSTTLTEMQKYTTNSDYDYQITLPNTDPITITLKNAYGWYAESATPANVKLTANINAAPVVGGRNAFTLTKVVNGTSVITVTTYNVLGEAVTLKILVTCITTTSVTVAANPQYFDKSYYYAGVPVTVIFNTDNTVFSVSYANATLVASSGTADVNKVWTDNMGFVYGNNRTTAFNADLATICAGLVGKNASDIAAWTLIGGSSAPSRTTLEGRLNSGTLTSSSGATYSNANVFNSIRLAALIQLGKAADGTSELPTDAAEIILESATDTELIKTGAPAGSKYIHTADAITSVTLKNAHGWFVTSSDLTVALVTCDVKGGFKITKAGLGEATITVTAYDEKGAVVTIKIYVCYAPTTYAADTITVAAAPQKLGQTYYYIGVPVTVEFGADGKVVSVSYDNVTWASTNGTINDHAYGASNSNRGTAFNADIAVICAGLVGKNALELAQWGLITTMGGTGVNRAMYEGRLSSGTLTASSGATLSNANVFNSIRLAARIYLGWDVPAVVPEVTLNTSSGSGSSAALTELTEYTTDATYDYQITLTTKTAVTIVLNNAYGWYASSSDAKVTVAANIDAAPVVGGRNAFTITAAAAAENGDTAIITVTTYDKAGEAVTLKILVTYDSTPA